MDNQKNYYHWPLLGNSQIKNYLQLSLTLQNMSHAYLFHGPDHLGKFTMAKYAATSLLCQASKNKKPCLSCPACEQIEKNIHADISIVKKESDKQKITIEQIRELQRKLSLRSFLTNYKVAIIDHAELMSEEAANALLKTLEEPSSNTIIILIANNLHLLPKTIISRCQSIKFNLVSTINIENWLIMQGNDKNKANDIAHLCMGRPGLAKIILSTDAIINEKKDSLDLLFEIINSNINDKFSILNGIIGIFKIKKDVSLYKELLDIWLSIYRDFLLCYYKNNELTNIFYKQKILSISKKINFEKIVNIIKEINFSKILISKSSNPNLVMENLILKI
ncbi:MAG: DNA polymerase III subunit delta' [Patescibacteria group bacterium]|jgi:DNA polymerase-3 subunit delta'